MVCSLLLFNGVCTGASSAFSSGVSCGITSRECGVPLQRLCISLALPLAGLKPVLREIRSTAHFILNGGSVGFSPVTLAKSLTAFYLSLTSFKWMDQCLSQESCDDKFIAFEALQKFVNDEQLYIKDYCSFMLILQFYSCWHSSWSLLLLTLACQEFRILSPTY